MAAFIIIAIFLLGTIIGSFLNVVIFRYHTGRGIGGRSMCLSCTKKLNWFELIPIMSFFMQGGKCTTCRSKISPIYPIVEFLSGFSFLFIFFHQLSVFSYDLSVQFYLSLIYFWSIGSILIMIATYDMRHKIVPNEPVYTFIALALLVPFFGQIGVGELLTVPSLGLQVMSANLFSGIVLALPFALLWLFSRGKWIGLGDAKIILGIGFLFGMSSGLAMLLLAFWMGAIVSILIVLLGKISLFKQWKNISFKSEIPFGPFLVLSAFIVFLFNLDLVSVIQFFQF